jgi:lysophospholipase L1-like esterase
MDMMRRWFTLVLLALLVLTWGGIVVYRYVLTPLRREEVRLRFDAFVYAKGPVVLVGDSIIAGIRPSCGSVINIATGGATIANLGAGVRDAVVATKPRRLVVLIGINDLRAGTAPAAVAQSIVHFVRSVRARSPATDAVVVSILPIVENDINYAARNDGIRDANERLKATLKGPAESFIDVTSLFGGDALAPDLTPDGLHLNARGLTILADVLLGGIARPPDVSGGCGWRQ